MQFCSPHEFVLVPWGLRSPKDFVMNLPRVTKPEELSVIGYRLPPARPSGLQLQDSSALSWTIQVIVLAEDESAEILRGHSTET